MTTCNAPITATPTDGEAFHTGRKLHRVECATHGLIHPGTTGPDHWSDAHRRTGEVWPVDRRAPTPTVAPGLDLDAVERAERAITPGPWRMHGYAAEIVDADDETVARLDMRGDRITGGDARVFSDAAGIVALRNAAPALIDEVRALRAAAEEREADMHARIRAGYDRTVADAWRAEVAKRDAEIARLTAELAAARAVPGDVEAAILGIFDGDGESLDRARTAIARAISDATAARGTVGGLLATAPNLSDDEGQYVANRIGLTYELSTDAGRGRAIKAMRAAEEIIARGPLPKGG